MTVICILPILVSNRVGFFFFKQKTAYEMRISDWSSDVCSSDLLADMAPRFARSLSAQFDVDELAGRLSPVLLEDQTVALFALAEHVGGDQADELARGRKSTRLNSSH